jgi:hypothetical protein
MTFSVLEHIVGQSGRHRNKINICHKSNMPYNCQQKNCRNCYYSPIARKQEKFHTFPIKTKDLRQVNYNFLFYIVHREVQVIISIGFNNNFFIPM